MEDKVKDMKYNIFTGQYEPDKDGKINKIVKTAGIVGIIIGIFSCSVTIISVSVIAILVSKFIKLK